MSTDVPATRSTETEDPSGGTPAPPRDERPSPPNPTQFIADPGPLGLGAFAMTTFVLSTINSGLIPESATPVVLGLAAFYGGLGQLLAGMWEFRKANTFGAVAFTSYGAFWLSFWFLVNYTTFGSGADTADAIGVYLLGWAIFTAYMTIAALRVSVAVTTIFVLLTVTFALLSIGEFSTSTGWTHAGGYVGLATAAAAWYASFAGVANATFGRTLLPVLPLADGAPVRHRSPVLPRS